MENINRVIQHYKMNEKEEFQRTVVDHLNNKASVIKLLNNQCIWFFEISDELKKDRDIVLLAIKKDGRNFEYLDDEFKVDGEIIKASFKTKHIPFREIFINAPSSVLNEPEIANFCLKKDLRTLEYLNENYSDNKQLLIDLKVCTLEYMSDKLKHDKDVVLNCVSQLGNKLQFASADLQDDYDVVLTAVKNEGDALRYASERLRTDPKIVKAAIRNDWTAASYISDEARSNKDIILYAIKKDFDNLQYASPELQEYYTKNPINW
jgi:hypothetical protein